MFSVRFKCYEAWTKQSEKCKNCEDKIHPQDIFEECLDDEGDLICYDCFESISKPTGEYNCDVQDPENQFKEE